MYRMKMYFACVGLDFCLAHSTFSAQDTASLTGNGSQTPAGQFIAGASVELAKPLNRQKPIRP